MTFTRRTGTVVGAAMVMATLAGARIGLARPASAASTHKVRFVETAGRLVDAKTVKGKIHGDFGKGTYVSKIGYDSAGNPKDTTVMTFRAGTIKFKENAKLAGKIESSKWTIVGGSGKYRHITGRGTSSGSITKLVFTYHGTVSY